MFRWRVEQIANTYATGPSAGSFGATAPWSSALWTVLFDIDGDGYRDLAAHLNGSSGSPSEPIDMIAGIWGDGPSQSIDYTSSSNINQIAHNPTAFIGPGSKVLNFAGNPDSPTEDWPNGASETTWDYGTTRARLVSSNSCNEYFIDYQIPTRLLDASSTGPNPGLNGPKITRDTPISMLFCTANSLNNPFQKDCAINRAFQGDSSKPGPFGDYLSFNKEQPYAQPIVSSVTATSPGTCPGNQTLSATIQDTLYVDGSGNILPSIKSVKFYYWYDKDGDGTTAGDSGSAWTYAVDGNLNSGTMNTWSASWDSTALPKGQFLIGVQAVDDRTLHDDGIPDAPIDNRTLSYLPGSSATATQAQIYNNDWRFDGNTKSWVQGSAIGWVGTGVDEQQALFPGHSPAMTPGASEDWYGNPDVTGVQTALIGLAINACGVAPAITKTASASSVSVGQEVAFTLTINNPANNPNPVNLSQLQDVLPGGFSYKAGSSTGVFGSADPGISGQTLTWSGSTAISPGASATQNFIAIAPGVTGTYSNVATAITDFGVIVSDPLQIGVGAARLTISKTPGTSNAIPGSIITYTITYSNDSPVNATGVSISDALPAGLTYVADSCGGGCTYTPGTGTLDWFPGNLAAGEGPYNLTFQAAVDSPYSGATTSQNTATINSVETAPASSTAAVYIDTPRPTLTLSKIASTALVAPGNTVTFTLSYADTGNASATNVVLSDPLPSGFNYVSATGSPTSAPSVGTNGTVSWNLGTLAAGESGSVTVTARASSPFTGEDNPGTNVASISSTEITTPVTDSAAVGVTQSGQVCSTYYMSGQQGNVGFDGNQYLASTALPSGATTTIATLADDDANPGIIEIARFYQDPASSQLVTFDGASTLGGQLDYNKTANLGGSANANSVLYLTVYDYDPVTGTSVQIAQSSKTDNGSPSPPVELTGVTPVGSLAKGHRLLIVMGVDMASKKATTIELQANSIDSFVEICAPPPANLVLEKSVDSASINVSGSGRSLTYTLNYANTSSVTAASNASIVDTLPASGVSYNSCTVAGSTHFNQCAQSAGTVTFSHSSGATVPAGESGSVTVTVDVADSLSGISSLINSAQIQSTQTTLAPPDGAEATTIVTGAISNPAGTPDVLIDKQASKTLLIPGDSVTYTLTVLNAGDKTATNVLVSDTFPAQTWFSYSPGTITGGSARNDTGNPLTWTIDTLAPGDSTTLSFEMAVANDGSAPAGVETQNNTASLTYGGGGTGTASSNTAQVSISTNPNLSITKSATDVNGGSLEPDDTLTYTLLVTNDGSGSASDVVVSDPIPANTSYKGSITATAGTGSFDAVNNRAVFDLGTLAAAGTVTLSFEVTVDATLDNGSTTLINTATVSAANASTRTGEASSTADAATVLTLSKSGQTSIAYPATTLTAEAIASTTVFVNSTAALEVGQFATIGAATARVTALGGTSLTLDTAITATAGEPVIGAATYSLTYQNTGNANASSVVLTDSLPAGLGYFSSSPAADSDPGTGSSGDVTWNLGSLAPGISGSVQVIAFPTGLGTVTNSANIVSDETTPVSDTADTIFGGLTVTKSTSTATATGGSTAAYTITVTNSTGSAINSVEVKDLLPSGFTYAAGSTLIGGSGAADPAGDIAQPVWTIDVPASTSVSITFQADIAASVGAATYQNGVELTRAGVGIVPFDPLATSADDVTVLAAGTGMVTGTVYRDNDGNGDFSASVDTPLTDVAVTLIDDTDTVYVANTDSAGSFSRVVSAGSTIVDVDNGTLPGILVLTTGTDGIDPATITVPDGGSISKDTGFVPATGTVGSVSGTVYDDDGSGGGTAGNSVQDGTEPGMPGIQVILRDATTGDAVATAYTDVLGNYSFPNVATADYIVDVVPATGYLVTSGNDPAPVTVTDGGTATANFGLQPGQVVSGTVFDDIDGSAIQDGAETGTNAGGLNVVLVDGSDEVLAVVPVALDGAWTSLVRSGSGYSAFITTANPTVGDTLTPTAALPSGWQVTGENFDGTSDPDADGILPGIDANTGADNLNFGVATMPDVYTAIDAPASVAAGSPVTALLTFGNQGPMDAAGVTYSVTLPAGLTGLACSGATCDYNDTTGALTLTGLPTVLAPGQDEQVLVTYAAPGTGPLDVTSVIATTTSGENPTANNTATSSTAVSTSLVDVVATLSAPTSALAGSSVSVSVSFTNLGGTRASDVSYSLTLPAGLADVTCTGSGVSCSYTSGTGIVTITGLPGALDPGQSVGFTLGYTAPGSGTVNVTATATVGGVPGDSSPANNTATDDTVINATASAPDVLSTVAPPASTAAGSTVTVPVTYRNLGPDAATVTLYDLDLTGAAVTQIEVRNDGALCNYTSGTGAITDCNLPATLNPGQAVDLTLTYTAPASGTVTVTSNITVSQSETNSANNTATGSTTVSSATVPDIYTVVDVPATVAAGDTVNALVVFGNQGVSAASAVSYQINLPPGLSGASCSGATCSYDSTTGVTTVTGLPDSLSPGQSVQLQIAFMAPAAASELTVASAIATGVAGETPTVNNNAEATTLVQAGSAADTTTWIEAPGGANAGESVEVFIGYSNLGNADATSVAYALTFSGSPGSIQVSYLGVACSYNSTTGAITGCALPGTLTPGQTIELAATYLAPVAGPVEATATVSAANDVDTGNNTARDSTAIDASVRADVTAAVAPPSTATPGSAVSVPLTFGNLGPDTAAGVTYRLDLTGSPTSVVISYLGSTCSYDSGSGAITGCGLPTSLNSSQSIGLTLDYLAPGSGSVTVTGTVNTTTPEDNTGNNVASGSTTVVSVGLVVDVYTTINAPANVAAGSPVNVTLTFGNRGSGNASGVSYSVLLPAGLSGVSCPTAGVSCSYDSASGLVTLSGLPTSLSNGQTVTATLRFTAPMAIGPLTVTALTSATADPGTAGNNSIHDTIVITASPRSIPTLSGWVTTLLILLVGLLGAQCARRQASAAKIDSH